MKRIIFSIFIFSFFSLLSMFNAAVASNVYVIGSPTVFPKRHKTIPVLIKIIEAPVYGVVLVSIEESSRMNGYTTNYPVNDYGDKTDMLLIAADNPGSTDLGTGVLKYEFPANYAAKRSYDISVNVRCYDYGAWGKIKATLYKKTGTDANGNDIYAKVAENTGTAPRDENNNHIADGWESDFYPYIYSDKENLQVDHGKTKAQPGIQNYPYGVPFLSRRKNTVDAEKGPLGNKENGDGFTVFEEYRGFMVYPSRHERFSPSTKEVGIGIANSMTKYGTGNAGYHSPSFYRFGADQINNLFVSVRDASHKLNSDVSDETGWINTNSDRIPNTEYVYAVRIQDAGSHPTNTGVLGLAPMYKPNKLSFINIYVDQITKFQRNDLPNLTVKQIVSHVMGHEVGHTVNLDHCPENCAKNTTTCIMRPFVLITDNNNKITGNHVGSSPSSYHYIDYDLVSPVKTPQKEWTPPKPKKPAKSPAPTRKLSPSGGSYTASAGDTHTANFSTDTAYSSVYWYVKAPSDTSTYGKTIEIDKGDGSATTADFTYTFPSGVSGDYKITAYVYPGTGSVYEDSYTVSVSTSSTTTLTYSLSPSGGSYTATAGDMHTANFSTSSPYSSVYWYIKTPDDTSYYGTNQQIDYGDGSKTTASYTYQFPSGTARTYQFIAYVYPASGSVYETSYKVTVVLPGTFIPTNNAPSGSSAPTITLGPGSGYTSTATVGSSYTLSVTVSEPVEKIKWYWQRPGYTETHLTTDNFYDGKTTSAVNYLSFDGPDTTEYVGKNLFRVEVKPVSTINVYEATYTVTVK